MDEIGACAHYLELLQGAIGRMSGHSFALKGWAVTLAAGMFALAGRDGVRSCFPIVYLPIALFWFLDAYYLQLERKYQVLYNRARAGGPPSYEMAPPPARQESRTCYYQCLLSKTEVSFYGVLLLAATAVLFV